MNTTTDYKIIETVLHVEKRFVIVDSNTLDVVDNCLGFGFKTMESAKRALWYRFQGGKEVIQGYKDWWKQHPEFNKSIVKFMFDNRRDIQGGYINVPEKITELAQGMNIEGFKPVLLKYRE